MKSAHVVDTLSSMFRDESNIGLGYFYCTFDNSQSQQPANILGSIVAQLSKAVPSILDSIRPIFEALSDTHKSPVELPTLEAALREHSARFKRVFVLIDAINESIHLSTITSSLRKMLEQSQNLRVLVTSIADASSLQAIDPTRVVVVEMHSNLLQKDIAAFVENWLQSNENLRHVSAKLKSDIKNTLLLDANGSYVLYLIIDSKNLLTVQVSLGTAFAGEHE